MKLSILFCIVIAITFVATEKCSSVRRDNCGPIAFISDFSQNLSLYSEPNFKGEHQLVNITGPFGCTNDVPDFRIKSLLSTGSTQVTLHYGKDCAGHVLKQYQGGSDDIDESADCPGSIFVKHHRTGSC